MSYSSKQWKYASNMLQKIGIPDSRIAEYLELLSQKFGRWVEVGEPNAYGQYRYRFSNSLCIDWLIKEIRIKEAIWNRGLDKYPDPNVVTASQLSMFVYCPASASISETVDTRKDVDKDYVNMGTFLHEQGVLSNVQNREFKYFDRGVMSFSKDLQDLSSLEVIYKDHSAQSESELLKNHDSTFYGKPDYILEKNKRANIVVEEKFSKRKYKYDEDYVEAGSLDEDAMLRGELKITNSNDDVTDYRLVKGAFDNHVMQVLSYLYEIKDCQLTEGYILYWYYDIVNDEPKIHSYQLIKISVSAVLQDKYQFYKRELIKLRTNKEVGFKPQPVSKCVSCLVSQFCIHKTGKVEKVEYPYDVKRRYIKFVPYN